MQFEMYGHVSRVFGIGGSVLVFGVFQSYRRALGVRIDAL